MSEPAHPHESATVCAWHPDRRTGLRCTRCDRPACPDCLREAPVGYHCRNCVKQDQRTQRVSTTVAGAQLRSGNLVIPVLIALNVGVYAVTAAQAGDILGNAASPLFGQWALIPSAIADGQLWRLLTSGFLHFGVLHLGVNMLALYIIGRDLETVLGWARFLTIYVVSLLGGSALVFAFGAANTVTAGASSAVFGVMGGLLVVLLRLRRSPGPALGIIAINVIITFTIPNIAILGHLGGLAFGTAGTAALVYAPRHRRLELQATGIGALAGLVVVLVLLGYAPV